MTEAQKWLKDNYENQKDNVTEINSKGAELEAELIIDDYPKLKQIFLDNAKGITKLSINNCSNVEVIFVSNNQITKIEGTTDLLNLRKLSFGNNKVEKIDISKNEKLEMIYFARNPKNLEFVNGIKSLSKLVFWNSHDTFSIATLLEEAIEDDLKEIAKELKLKVDKKTPEEIKKLINQEINNFNQSKEKLNKEFPSLISDKNEVDEKKNEEIKNNIDKSDKYQKLVDEANNSPIVDTDKKEIDQSELTGELKKAAEYEKLVADKNNQDLVTDNKIDQEKINNLKNNSKDAENALPILGVNDLKTNTLNDLLGGSKLSDIPKSETLKSVLEKNKKLEDALNDAGINPNEVDLEKKIAMLKGLEKRVKEIYGDNFEEILEVQEYQSQIEVNTNKI